MRYFIDEGGQFTPANGWAVVCSLALPHKEVGPARREIDRLSQLWPRIKGELKGGALSPDHLEQLVDVLFRHDALLQACVIDVSHESQVAVERHKTVQAEGITKYLVPTHHPDLIKEVWELRNTLERMPNQLYIQSVLMRELVAWAVEETTMYFSQRRPRELAQFEWTIDAKDPRRISTQEAWWRDTLAPLLESRTRRRPLIFVNDPTFNYRFFNRKFSMRKEMWRPDGPREIVDGSDIKTIMTERMAFIDSRSEILIQAVDILTSFLRRLLSGEIAGDEITRALGKLQIFRKRGGRLQSLEFISLSRERSGPTGLAKTLQLMTRAGRTMIKPKRGRAA
jgi:hypothetical protein